MSEPFNRPPAGELPEIRSTTHRPPPEGQPAATPPADATGWRCPGCAGCYAPWVQTCPNCRPDVLRALREHGRVET